MDGPQSLTADLLLHAFLFVNVGAAKCLIGVLSVVKRCEGVSKSGFFKEKKTQTKYYSN